MLDQLIIVLATDPVPDDTEVKAGPLGFAIWIFMILAVVVLAFSLVKQLRKAEAAKNAGLYGDEPILSEADLDARAEAEAQAAAAGEAGDAGAGQADVDADERAEERPADEPADSSDAPPRA